MGTGLIRPPEWVRRTIVSVALTLAVAPGVADAQTAEPLFSCAAFPDTLGMGESQVVFAFRFDAAVNLEQVNLEFSGGVNVDVSSSQLLVNGVPATDWTIFIDDSILTLPAVVALKVGPQPHPLVAGDVLSLTVRLSPLPNTPHAAGVSCVAGGVGVRSLLIGFTESAGQPGPQGPEGPAGPAGPPGPAGQAATGSVVLEPLALPNSPVPTPPSGYIYAGSLKMERPDGEYRWFAVFVRVAP